MNTEHSDRFALLNNGVTVVARDIKKVGAKFRLEDYQIVNGCQTSHVLYLNRNFLTQQVHLPIKLIVTNDNDVTNQIIQGTNSQTEVKPEAFESLSPFQKKLEEFYLAFGRDRPNPLYYERRSKQYEYQTGISRQRVITLASQIKCFVAMFLNEPHSTHRYYGELLTSYSDRLFNESDRFHPYFTAASALVGIERSFSRGKLAKSLKNFKFQLLMIFRIRNSIRQLPALNSKAMEIYCTRLLDVLDNEQAAEEAFSEAAGLLERVRDNLNPWREPPERTRAFTLALIDAASGGRPELPASTAMVGGTVKWFSDIKGYGFITADDGREVFVHQSAIAGIGWRSPTTGQRVQFALAETSKGFQAARLIID